MSEISTSNGDKLGYLLKFERIYQYTLKVEKQVKKSNIAFNFKYDVDNFIIYGMYDEQNYNDSESQN